MNGVVTIDDVRSVASGLPCTTEAVVRGRVKFRVGRIVYLAFSRDATVMGFAFPEEWREALVEHAQQRAESVQNRIADQITDFAGPMWFVYTWIHRGGRWVPSGARTRMTS